MSVYEKEGGRGGGGGGGGVELCVYAHVHYRGLRACSPRKF